MTFGLQHLDDFQRIQAQRAFSSAVIFQVALTVAFDSICGDETALNRQFRNAALGDE